MQSSSTSTNRPGYTSSTSKTTTSNPRYTPSTSKASTSTLGYTPSTSKTSTSNPGYTPSTSKTTTSNPGYTTSTSKSTTPGYSTSTNTIKYTPPTSTVATSISTIATSTSTAATSTSTAATSTSTAATSTSTAATSTSTPKVTSTTHIPPNYIHQCDRTDDPVKQQCCMMVQQWSREKDAIVAAGLVNDDVPPCSSGTGSDPYSSSGDDDQQQPPLSDLAEMYYCMDIPCLCKVFNGQMLSNGNCAVIRNGQTVEFGKGVRQECRTLSTQQRENLFRAYHALKWGNQQNNYNLKVYMHQAAQAPIAHGDPMFPHWHREFIKRFEFDLRCVDPTVMLCYWDSSLDNYLDDPRDSCMWTEDFMGETKDGVVINGPFKNWTTPENTPLQREFSDPAGCIDISDVKRIPEYDQMSLLAFIADTENCTDPAGIQPQYNPFEFIHGGPHVFIGGHMGSTQTAPIDPMFYLHHCFIDYLLESWRVEQSKEGRDPTTYYPETYIVDKYCAHINNSLSKPMLPFTEITNQWGLRVDYTQNLYTFAPSPTCSKTQSCGSDFLFCCYNPSPAYCVAKIRLGGSCQKFATSPTADQTSLSSEHINPCYKGRCVNGICVSSTSSLLEETEQENVDLLLKLPVSLPVKPKTLRKLSKIKIPSFRVCYDNHECCPTWSAAGRCDNEDTAFFMNIWCPGSCECDGCRQPILPKIGCDDLHPSCKRWLGKKKTECTENQHWMAANCAKSCGLCNKRPSIAETCGSDPAKKYYVSKKQLKSLLDLV